jgi:hypothetical protein
MVRFEKAGAYTQTLKNKIKSAVRLQIGATAQKPLQKYMKP